MAIEFSCQCGKQIKVAEKFAGRRAKCPGCGKPVTIPQPDMPDDEIDGNLLYEAVGSAYDTVAQEPEPTRVCGGCGKPMPDNSVLCTHCGFHRISGTYVKVADAADAKAKEARGPMFSIAGVGMRFWLLLILLAVLIGVPVWYVTGPGRAMHVVEQQTVSVIRTIKSGKTREPFSLFTQQGDRSLGIKGPKSKSNPNPFMSDVDEVYSMGSSDTLIVTTPDDKGDHLLLKVALKQDAIRAAGRTSGYDSVLAGKDFKLVPDDGGPAVDAELLYVSFDGKAEVDIGGADTSSYEALFPTQPTRLDVDEQPGSVSGKAVWNQHNAKGEITFFASRSTGDMPAAKGLTGNGKLKLYNNQGQTTDLAYNGGTLEVKWGPDATGWWSKRQFKKMSQDNPWYRYNVGLLFERPQAQGEYTVTYCDKPVASVFLMEKPAPKPPPTSPIKRAQGIGQPAAKTSNNPLVYFDILLDARGQAKGIVSAQNLRQIGMGLQMYLNEHNQWPDRLDQLSSVIDGFDQLMVNPRTGDHPGFIYTKPEPGADPATTAVVHESWQGQPDPNGAVLYADGHFQ